MEKRTSRGTIWKSVKFSTERRIANISGEVLKSKLGKTKITEHRILTGVVAPIRQRPYRIPHALKQKL